MTNKLSSPEAFRVHTRSGVHVLDVAVADSFWSRFRGLMLAPQLAPSAGLLLKRCDSVHCAFMRQAIDVIYLDAEGTVLKCVPQLAPWRASFSNTGRDAHGQRHVRARHTLELAAGSIARLDIAPGDRLDHPSLSPRSVETPAPLTRQAQRGSALLEFVVVGPMLTLIGLGILQYSMIFFTKNQLNHASFMAARAGSLGHARLTTIESAYAQALVPLLTKGTTPDKLARALVDAELEVAGYAKVEILNPTRESFADWGNEPALMQKYNTQGKRVIPNSGQGYKDQQVRLISGQTIQDANLIKLRITHGYEPKIPIARSVFRAYLKATDPGNNATYTRLVQANRIPVVTNVTLHMQSDAIEGVPISTPGAGNNGTPTNPGDPPVSPNPPPNCTGVGCNQEDPIDPNTPCTGTDCPICTT